MASGFKGVFRKGQLIVTCMERCSVSNACVWLCVCLCVCLCRYHKTLDLRVIKNDQAMLVDVFVCLSDCVCAGPYPPVCS